VFYFFLLFEYLLGLAAGFAHVLERFGECSIELQHFTVRQIVIFRSVILKYFEGESVGVYRHGYDLHLFMRAISFK